MDKNTFIQRVLAGASLLSVEYRGWRVDHIEWRDKGSGKAMAANLLKHTVELGPISVSVSQRMPSDWTGMDYRCPFVKGSRCVLDFTSFSVTRGNYEASGVLEPLVDSPAGKV